MKLVKLDLPKEENIIENKEIIINELVPITIRLLCNFSNLENALLLLFATKESITKEWYYFQLIIKCDSKAEYNKFLSDSSLMIYGNDTDSKDVGKKIYDVYSQNINDDNIFNTDFRLTECLDQALLWKFTAVRPVSKTEAKVLNVKINQNIFMKLNIYLSRLLNKIFMLSNYEEVFFDKKFDNFEVFKVDNILYKCSTVIDTKNNISTYMSNYKITDGKNVYGFNWINLLESGKILKNELNLDAYMDLYQNDMIIIDSFLYDNKFYICYDLFDNITGEFKSLRIFRIGSKNMLSKTNFIDQYNIFVKPEGEE